MLTTCLDKLEYYPILEQLKSYAKTEQGKEQIALLRPCFEKDEVQSKLDETTQAFCLLQRKGMAPVSSLPSLFLSLKQLESNQPLSMKALLEIAQVLRMAKELKHYLFSDKEFDLSCYPIICLYFSSLYTNPEIEHSITSKILDENTIENKASDKLFHIRKEIRKTEEQIKEKLTSYIHSSTYSKYIQESIITVRNERYVIPVKEEYRSYIKGLIHDISASGSTVFIEPMPIFELNNRMNQLKIEEKQEIEKILQQLSASLIPIISSLRQNEQSISQIDFAYAKANYALALRAACPTLNSEKQLSLLEVRHPLIAKEKVVPITITLGKTFSTLVITGPNTGGKTVTLKTVGLICLMAMSGLYIPAKETSSIYVFDQIFADIGDNQSIEESLSTFSSHMINLIHILKQATSQSFVLVDELGSGTDPEEGSSLAVSILEFLHHKNCLTIATTHYPEIKHYALIEEGFENASCEFDLKTLCPTYHLQMGIPGRSNAFAISKQLGLPEEILKRASSFQKQDHIPIEEVLKNITEKNKQIEKEQEEIQKNLEQITFLRKQLEKKVSFQEEQEKQHLEKAKQEARQLLLSAKEQVNSYLKQLQDLSQEQQKNKRANQIRNEINASLKQFSPTISNLTSEAPSEEELKIGDTVLFLPLNQKGTVLSQPNKQDEILLQLGSMKMNVPITQLRFLEKSSTSKQNSSFSMKTHSKSQTVVSELNLIGLTVEEALPLIDKYLDDCALSKLSSVRIVHGKGTGKLRQGIHTFLKKNPHVKSYRIGTFGEGEMGVTVVELK